MSFDHTVAKKFNRVSLVLIPVLSYILSLSLVSCTPRVGVDKKIAPSVDTKSAVPSKGTLQVKDSLVSPSQKDITTFSLGPSMLAHLYKEITQKISTGEYHLALNELEQLIDRYTTPQMYVVEAHLLRFIMLSGYRAAYLNLAEAYHLGWEEVHGTRVGKVRVEERIGRLTNLDKASLEYFQQHKEMVIGLINAYEEFKILYPVIKSERLRIIADPLKVVKDEKNTLLEHVKKGVWLETAERLKAEKNEINSCILDYWTKLMGVKDVHRANRLLGHGPHALNKSDFFTWLGESMIYQVDSARPEAFKDEAELVDILKSKSTECINLAK